MHSHTHIRIYYTHSHTCTLVEKDQLIGELKTDRSRVPENRTTIKIGERGAHRNNDLAHALGPVHTYVHVLRAALWW